MKLRPVSFESPITADDVGKWAVTRGGLVAWIDDIDTHNDATVCGTLYTARDRGISAYWFRTGLFSALREPHQNDIVEIIEPDPPHPDKHVGDLVASAETLIQSIEDWMIARGAVGDDAMEDDKAKSVMELRQSVKAALAAYEAALAKGST